MISKRLIAFWVMMFCFVALFAAGKHRYTLVIDAGHGGKDAGACAHGAKEKTINLNVALAFGRYVERNCPDVHVIYTRKTDKFIPLHERAAIANRNKADVFISIHTNSVASKRPISGMETYTMGIRRSDEKLSAAKRENEVISLEDNYQQHYAGYDPRSPESMLIFEVINENNMAESVELARLIQQYTCATARRPNKGVRQDAFLVLRETSMPACLVELGYITTASEKNFLTSTKNVDLMGYGIYQAFVAFKNKHQGKGIQTKPVAVAEPATENEPVAEASREEPRTEAPKEEPKGETLKDESNSVQQEEEPVTVADANSPVFKVQFLTSGTKLKRGDSRLKGITGADCYREGGLWKYTVGASADYNEVNQLRKKIEKKFPRAFVIAFRNGEKMDAAKAYQEFRQNKKNR